MGMRRSNSTLGFGLGSGEAFALVLGLGLGFGCGFACTFACTLAIPSFGLVRGWIWTLGRGALLVGLILTLSRIAKSSFVPLLPFLSLFFSFFLFLSSLSFFFLSLLLFLFLPLPASLSLPSSSLPSCSAGRSWSCT